MTTEELFLKWWLESYPGTIPGEYAKITHVGFANYLDSIRRMELLQAMGKSDGDLS